MAGKLRSLRFVLPCVAAALLAAPASGQQKPPSPAGPPVAPPTAPPVVPDVPRPDGDDVVVLEDGTVLTGSVVPGDNDVTVTSATGARQVVPRRRVSIAVNGGKVVHRGEQTGIWRAWRAWAGKAPATGAPEADGSAWRDRLHEAADACATRKMPYAASALLADAADAGLWNEDSTRRALEWEPVEFPFSPEDEVRGKLVAQWARELVPLGGRFILRKDPTDGTARSSLWTSGSVAVRTRNLVVYSLDVEVRVVGSLLAQGEATIRNLEALFGRPDATEDPMEIRLYENRKQYLSESDGVSGLAPVWSGGFFSPSELVSRFYVTRAAKTGAYVEPELHEVLSHELTHHWIEMRYCVGAEYDGATETPGRAVGDVAPRRRIDQAGHWIVEGIARFVEDQAILWKKNGPRFDDAAAECVVSAKGAWRTGCAIPIARYVDISPKEFQFLSDAPRMGPRASKADPYFNTERGVFYDQGGALAFFLMNLRGDDGRKLLLAYLRDVYGGRMQAKSWERLGFASADELEKAFSAFLTGKK